MAGRCCDDNVVAIQSTTDPEGNASVNVTGAGTATNPFKIQFAGLQAVDTDSIDLTLVFTPGVGFQMSAALGPGSKLDHLGDVVITGPTNGQVLGYNSTTQQWKNQAPTTAAAGSVQHETSLAGDGSAGTPLAVLHSPTGGTETSPYGIKLTDPILNSTVRHYVDATARAADSLTPLVNTTSVLDSAPGKVDIWTGSAWVPLQQVSDISGEAFMALSGVYDGRPVVMYVNQVDTSTSSSGVFEAIPATDLSTAAGVLSVSIQPTGSVPFIAVAKQGSASVNAAAYAADGSGLLVSSPVSCTVIALLY